MADRASPLARLSYLLRRGAPPSLESLQAWLQQGEGYREFVALTRQYLPQYEAEILAEVGVGVRVAAFARRFKERYFPLPDPFEDGWIEEYEKLVYQIPIIRMGLSYDDYHQMPEDWLPGYQLLAVLSEDPYEDPGEEYGGGRTALLESCSQHIPRELLQRTGQGFSRDTLHARLDGTRFEAAALMADWLHCATDNGFLDTTDEIPVDASWDLETVQEVTEHWARATDIQERIHSLAERMIVDPPARFREILEFIENERKGDEHGELR